MKGPFISEELNKIHEESKHVIEAHLQKLQGIRDSILIIENILSRAAIHFNYSMNISDSEVIAYGPSTKRIMYMDKNNVGTEKPLFETKVSIRLKSSEFLSDFLKTILGILEKENAAK